MPSPYFETFEEPDIEIAPDPDEVSETLMFHAMDMVYRSLNAASDADWQQDRDHYADELALETRIGRREVA